MLVDVVQLRHFFSKLDNPEWITPLAARGYFKEAPRPIREPDGSIRYPPWQPIFYLDRMAAHSEYSSKIAEILTKVKDNDNVFAISKMADIILKLDPQDAIRALPQLKAWLKNIERSSIELDAGNLVKRFLEAGQAQAALELSRTLFEVLPPDPAPEGRPFHIPRVNTRIDRYWYQQILSEISTDLARKCGREALSFVIGLLENALAFESAGRGPPHDASYIWRPAIDAPPERSLVEIPDTLLVAARDISEVLAAEADDNTLKELIHFLETRPWNAEHRLAWHLLTRHGARLLDEIAARLTNKTTFDDSAFRHEYYVMAKAWYSVLPAGVKSQILNLVLEGPDHLPAWIEYVRERTGSSPSTEEQQAYQERWWRDRLSPIKDHLPAELHATYDQWIIKYGPPEFDEATVRHSGGFVGPASPKKANDLLGMSDDELHRFLTTYEADDDEAWAPEGWEDVGLARELESAVKSDPNRFAARSVDFAKLRPRFVKAIANGFTQAVKGKSGPDWETLLHFTEAALEHRSPEVRGELEMGLLSLLDVGLRESDTACPIDLRGRLWAILQRLSSHPNPTPEEEKSHAPGFGDLHGYSINTVRGTALRTVIDYALWVYRSLGDHAILTRDMPEVATLLEEHLDVITDPTPSTRTAYGERLPWLILMDKEWASRQVQRIFPDDLNLEVYRRAAWQGYMQLPRAYDDPFRILRAQYERAIQELVSEPNRIDTEETNHVAEHLMEVFWRGLVNLGDPDRLIEKFFERAPISLRQHAIRDIGVGLQHPQTVLKGDAKQRLEQLYDWRLDQTEDAEELEGFGRWYTSGHFDEPWATSRLLKTLQKTGFRFHDEDVIGVLAKSAASIADKVSAIELLIKRDEDYWRIENWLPEGKPIIEEASRSTDAVTRGRAAAIIDDLVRRGFHDLRSLYPK